MGTENFALSLIYSNDGKCINCKPLKWDKWYKKSQ